MAAIGAQPLPTTSRTMRAGAAPGATRTPISAVLCHTTVNGLSRGKISSVSAAVSGNTGLLPSVRAAKTRFRQHKTDSITQVLQTLERAAVTLGI
jgi:hypothetical protein